MSKNGYLLGITLVFSIIGFISSTSANPAAVRSLSRLLEGPVGRHVLTYTEEGKALYNRILSAKRFVPDEEAAASPNPPTHPPDPRRLVRVIERERMLDFAEELSLGFRRIAENYTVTRIREAGVTADQWLRFLTREFLTLHPEEFHFVHPTASPGYRTLRSRFAEMKPTHAQQRENLVEYLEHMESSYAGH